MKQGVERSLTVLEWIGIALLLLVVLPHLFLSAVQSAREQKHAIEQLQQDVQQIQELVTE